MTEENSFFGSALKKFSTDEIQNAISDALTKLTGENHKTSIKNIDYEPNNMGGVEINLTIQKDFEWK